MPLLNHKGNVLLYAVVAITVISVLGTGIYFLTTTSAFSGLGANAQSRAYQLAVAGKDYALAKNLPATAGRDFTFSNGDKFRLVISSDTITSTGIVGEGTPYEARRTITITRSGFSRQADISFAKDMAAFAPGVKESQAGFVDVGQTVASQISLGQFIASAFGSVWYAGTLSLGNCLDGKCDFGTGFRVYFIFKLERYSTHIPHGFTFALFNGTDNNTSSAGGDYTMPELMAYGGNSCKYRDSSGNCTGGYVDPNSDVSKKGIQAPKMAIEFDGRQNCCDLSTCSVSSCKADFCNYARDVNSNSRTDGSRNHVAYVFWGDNTTACSNKENSMTYDDNKHGAGSAVDPINAYTSSDSSETSDYFTGIRTLWPSEWLFSGNVYAVRLEVTRASTPNTNNNYFYTINTWIKQCSGSDINDPSTCSEFQDLSNTKVKYDPNPPDLPTLTRTIELDKASHDKFNKFLFGWTAAAGSASREKLTLSNFQLFFEREPVACGGYSVWNNLGGPGTTRYFKINDGGCISINDNNIIGNIGPNGKIKGYTNALCTVSTIPSVFTYNESVTADSNKNCAVYFDGTDK